MTSSVDKGTATDLTRDPYGLAKLRRAFEDSQNRTGMVVGLPKVTVDASHVAHALVYVDSLRAALTAAGWQPIETSPKDGTEFQCWIVRDGDKDGFWEPRCRYNENGAFEIYQRIDYDQEDFEVCHFTLVPTHWMRQPEAPK